MAPSTMVVFFGENSGRVRDGRYREKNKGGEYDDGDAG